MWLTLNTHTYSQRLLFDGIMTFIRSKTDFLQTVYVLVEPDRYVANATTSSYYMRLLLQAKKLIPYDSSRPSLKNCIISMSPR